MTDLVGSEPYGEPWRSYWTRGGDLVRAQRHLGLDDDSRWYVAALVAERPSQAHADRLVKCPPGQFCALAEQLGVAWRSA